MLENQNSGDAALGRKDGGGLAGAASGGEILGGRGTCFEPSPRANML